MLGISLNRGSDQPLKRQVYAQIRGQMLSGQLEAGERLPSTRDLANALGVSRNTIGEAYDMLMTEGYLTSRQGAVSRVVEGLSVRQHEPGALVGTGAPHEPNNANEPILSSEPKKARERAVSEAPVLVDFRTGRPDLRLFPRYAWRQLISKAAQAQDSVLFSFSGPQGLSALRKEIAAWLARSRGLAVGPERVFITSGATQALHVLADMLCGNGGRVLMEDPCHSGMRQTFLNKGCFIEPIPVDDRGMMVGALPDEDACAIYVTPSHQFPLGGILPAARRAELVRFAQQRRLYVIEDDYDSEFRFGGEPVAPMCAMDGQTVIYVGTFSKSLFPALRIGFVVLPDRLHKQWCDTRTYMDVQNPTLEQAALADMLHTRRFDKHVQKMRHHYGQRRKILLESLHEAFDGTCHACGDAAGLHVAVDFPGMRFDDPFRRYCRKNGIHVTPVERHCIVKEQHQSKILFGYGHLDPEEIREGVLLFRDVMQRYDTGC